MRTEYLSSTDLFLKEPSVFPDDSHLDAHRAVAYIDKETESLQHKEDMPSSIMNPLQHFADEIVGFDTEADEFVIRCIWERAAEFFPKLRDIFLEDIIRNRKVRVGLRPYMPDGKPVIGSVPGLQNLYLVAGNEGGGLSMALGTAEVVSDMVLGKPSQVASSTFGVGGRCC
ncbi:PREDICTED: uncharacterized protein LOC104728685 [Camelina sativa]|uniref:FAD-dependent oxidoreductase domain-containing protein 1 n=1 Tax=Camelina sativa TaxID=90675 RepID=A0ABM0UT71_CAMSA|nr:PREDICTED: uncharacterized protein LOC104728685 [Camelina sativa]